jgi:hypothetical protein
MSQRVESPTNQHDRTQSSAWRSQKSTGNSASSKRGGGRQRGLQGYSKDNCNAMVDIVKSILPLWSNKWEQVHKLYTAYAKENGRVQQDCDPLRTKFKAIAGSKKGTGDPTFPSYIRKAKRASNMIKD